MIDLDQMDAQLAAATTDVAGPRSVAVRTAQVPAPTPAPAPTTTPRSHRRAGAARPAPALGLVDLLEAARLDDVDALIAATSDRRDRLTWTTMRALLDGRGAAAHTAVRELTDLARSGDAVALGRSWTQRFWAALEWGTDGERYEVLNHCRERAYRFEDLPWWGNLTLLLAELGKGDEASRAFDWALPLAAGVAGDPTGLDAVTNLIDAAAILGDAGRVAAAGRHLRAPAGRFVVVGDGVVCKGSTDRYAALVHAAQGQWSRAGECFRRAEEAHRAVGAGPLLARTLRQASAAPVAA